MYEEAKQAAYYRLALQLGTTPVSDVVRWVDSRIIAEDQPAETLLDLSLVCDSHPLDVIQKLGELSGSVTEFEVFATVLADAHARLVNDPGFGRSLAKNLYHLYVAWDYPDDFGHFGAFDDDYALADLGIFTAEDAYRRILEYTGRFVNEAI